MIKKLLYILIILFFAVSVQAAIYFVKNGGNNGLDGLSDGNAWETVAKVNTIDFADGDEIHFNKGDTFDDANLTFAGIDTNPTTKTITIDAYGAGALPWVGGGTKIIFINDDAQDGLSFVINNIKIDGQEGADWANIYIVDATNVTIDGVTGDGSINWVSDQQSAIKIIGHTGALEIKYCTILGFGGGDGLWDTPPLNVGTVDRGSLHVLDAGAAATTSIHDNDFQNIGSDGVIVEESHNVTIYDNTIWNCGENSIDLKGVHNATVYGNTVGRDATFLGAGGGSYTEGVNSSQGVIQILTNDGTVGGGCENVEIYENLIGPTDLVNLRFVRTGGTTPNDNISVHHNYFKTHDAASSDRATHIWMGAYNESIKIYHNIFDGLQEGGSFYVEFPYLQVPTIAPVIYGNVFYSGTDEVTSESGKFSGTAATASRIEIWDYNAGCSNSTWRNNIFYINDTTDKILYVDPNCAPVFSDNIWYNANAGDDTIIQYAGEDTYEENELAAWNAARGGGGFFENPDMNDPANDLFYIDTGAPGEGTAYAVGSPYNNCWTPGGVIPPNEVVTIVCDEIGAYSILDVTEPTVTAKVIESSGTVFRVTFSEKVWKGASYADAELNLDFTAGTGAPSDDITLTYTEIYGGGTGTNTWYFTIGETIPQDGTVNFDLSATANVIEDHAITTEGNDVAQITDGATDNQSAQGYPPTTRTGVGVSIN